MRHFAEIRKEFKYKKQWIDYSNRRLEGIKSVWRRKDKNNNSDNNITFVGVHVRRTDYVAYMKRYESRDAVGVDYFKAAIQYFRDNKSKCGLPVFLVVSDDKDWVEQNLMATADDDVFIAANGHLEHAIPDLALLSKCNHSIIDYGTYGLWTGLYTQGHVIMVKYEGDQIYTFLRGNPKWHFVNVTKKPIVIP